MLLTLVLALSGGGALAQGLPLLRDDPVGVAQTWGPPRDGVVIDGSTVTVAVDKNGSYSLVESARKFSEVKFAVAVTAVSATGDAGPEFWSTGSKDFYAFVLAPDGNARALRQVGGKWVGKIDLGKIPAAKTGPGARNEMAMVTGGRSATLYVNGAKQQTIDGEPPAAGTWRVGLLAEGTADASAQYSFEAISATMLGTEGEGAVFRTLKREGMGNFLPSNATVISQDWNLTPIHGVTELWQGLKLSDGGSAELRFRFYATVAEAQTYVTGSTSPFAAEDEIVGAVSDQGHAKLEGLAQTPYYVMRIDPASGNQWVRAVVQDGRLVVLATLTKPDSGSGQVEQEVLSAAIRLAAAGLWRALAIDDARPRP
jgi:hypothetical protein